jgi:hypothetical protein
MPDSLAEGGVFELPVPICEQSAESVSLCPVDCIYEYVDEDNDKFLFSSPSIRMNA